MHKLIPNNKEENDVLSTAFAPFAVIRPLSLVIVYLCIENIRNMEDFVDSLMAKLENGGFAIINCLEIGLNCAVSFLLFRCCGQGHKKLLTKIEIRTEQFHN